MRSYKFKAKLWKHKGNGGWCFVTLPGPLSKKIRQNHGDCEEGWGRLKTEAKVGDSKWQTAIWYDTKRKAYLLPIKSEIRNREALGVNAMVQISLQMQMGDKDRLPFLES